MKIPKIRTLLFMISVLFFKVNFSQNDTIYFANETKILARDIYLELPEIHFYQVDSTVDIQRTVQKNDIRFIAYASGKIEVYSLRHIGVPKNYPIFNKGIQDAEIYYQHSGGSIATGFISFFTGGIIGLIPAIACSATTPKIQNLSIPYNAPAYSKDYLLGYYSKAKKIKQKKVWTAYFVGTIAAGITVAALRK